MQLARPRPAVSLSNWARARRPIGRPRVANLMGAGRHVVGPIESAPCGASAIARYLWSAAAGGGACVWPNFHVRLRLQLLLQPKQHGGGGKTIFAGAALRGDVIDLRARVTCWPRRTPHIEAARAPIQAGRRRARGSGKDHNSNHFRRPQTAAQASGQRGQVEFWFVLWMKLSRGSPAASLQRAGAERLSSAWASWSVKRAPTRATITIIIIIFTCCPARRLPASGGLHILRAGATRAASRPVGGRNSYFLPPPARLSRRRDLSLGPSNRKRVWFYNYYIITGLKLAAGWKPAVWFECAAASVGRGVCPARAGT